MRWIIIAVILLSGVVEADNAPKVILNVARCREFMAGFSDYEDYSLLDVYEWRLGMFASFLWFDRHSTDSHFASCVGAWLIFVEC
jgi:hypothetical protein